MLQVYLVRHGETQWNVAQRIQGQSDSPLTLEGERQAKLVANRVKIEKITHIISSDLNRAKQTAEIIAAACGGLQITTDSRLQELDMGVLEGREIKSLTEEEERWRRSIVEGSVDASIPEGESMAALATRMHAALESCLALPDDSKPLLVSHGIALSCLISTLLGLPAYSRRRLRLRNGSLSRIDYQKSSWLAEGWIIESTGDTSYLTDYRTSTK
ncbi:2,3-diphosphoglycerate-dependent phosphoglycerate mutase GpmB [Candidatus Regiella endosymbiont of Tuberolachnus salignus]|uniref:2,3-diphosphoglycerate-dependent phosphoglycerate mutase GpmB n=1 Tax=Candidatus Regiella endosymbiont of Tuberolachnus salignus TaxID=3077956 RepID=UPI0030CACFBC